MRGLAPTKALIVFEAFLKTSLEFKGFCLDINFVEVWEPPVPHTLRRGSDIRIPVGKDSVIDVQIWLDGILDGTFDQQSIAFRWWKVLEKKDGR